MSLLPSRGPETSTRQDGEFEVVGVDEDVAPVLDALASDTAREVLNEIYENPGTPSEIAGRLDMSIQKVAYHLEKLEDVDLIAVAGTRYSEKGQEMTVYEPPEDPLVLFVGTEERKSRLRSLVRRVVPTVGALAFGSLLVQRLFGGDWSPISFDGGDGADVELTGGDYEVSSSNGNGADGNGAGSGDAGGNGNDIGASEVTDTPRATDGGVDLGSGSTEAPEAMDTAAPTPEADTTESVRDTVVPESTGGDVPTEELLQMAADATDPGIEPGMAFFLGGLFAFTLVGAWWFYRTR